MKFLTAVAYTSLLIATTSSAMSQTKPKPLTNEQSKIACVNQKIKTNWKHQGKQTPDSYKQLYDVKVAAYSDCFHHGMIEICRRPNLSNEQGAIGNFDRQYAKEISDKKDVFIPAGSDFTADDPTIKMKHLNIKTIFDSIIRSGETCTVAESVFLSTARYDTLPSDFPVEFNPQISFTLEEAAHLVNGCKHDDICSWKIASMTAFVRSKFPIGPEERIKFEIVPITEDVDYLRDKLDNNDRTRPSEQVLFDRIPVVLIRTPVTVTCMNSYTLNHVAIPHAKESLNDEYDKMLKQGRCVEQEPGEKAVLTYINGNIAALEGLILVPDAVLRRAEAKKEKLPDTITYAFTSDLVWKENGKSVDTILNQSTDSISASDRRD